MSMRSLPEDKGRVHVLVGPVGAGKTTYAQQRLLRSPALFLDLDTWMVRLFGDDARPSEGVMAWYLERRERVRELIWDLTLQAVAVKTDVLLETGLVSRQERAVFYERVRGAGLQLSVFLIDAPRELRRARVLERNRSPGPYTQVVPPEFFELASDAWETPSEEERRDWSIVDV